MRIWVDRADKGAVFVRAAVYAGDDADGDIRSIVRPGESYGRLSYERLADVADGPGYADVMDDGTIVPGE